MLTERFPRPPSGTPAEEPRTTDAVKKQSRFVWALTAGLACAGICWGAQNPNPSQAPGAETRHAIAVTVAKAHEWEMQLELDLLADPLTFPYPLRAHVTTAGMEIQGNVPNVWIRDHALQLARDVSPVAVVDGMTVEPKMAIPLPHMQSPTLASDARQRLERAGIKLSGPVEILAPGNGQIILSGKIGSLEAKLAMSRALRGAAGCTCVRNELAVPGAVRPAVHVEEPPAAREPAKVVAVEHAVPAEPVASAPKVPSSPVTPMRGTLRKESNLAAGVPASVRFDDVEQPPARIVQTAGRPERTAKRETAVKAPTPTPKGPPSAEAQASIQKKLKSALRNSAREIVMQFDDNGGAKIRVKVAKVADVEKVHTVMQQISELAPYDLNIEFVIEQ